MKRLTAVIAVCAVAFIGCETTKGAGRDIQNTGSNIEQGINSSTTEMGTPTGNNTEDTFGTGTDGADTGVGTGNGRSDTMGGY